MNFNSIQLGFFLTMHIPEQAVVAHACHGHILQYMLERGGGARGGYKNID